VYFRPHGHHFVKIEPPLSTERRGRLREDVTRVTQDLARRFEELVRMAPEQWHVMQPNWPSDRDESAPAVAESKSESA
jgi:KDO2-lipid IV(A) lauroyltransferase